MPAGLPKTIQGRTFMQQAIPTGGRSGSRASWVTLGLLIIGLTACQDSVAPSKNVARGPSGSSQAEKTSNGPIAGEYIVVFNDDVKDIPTQAKGLVAANGGTLRALPVDDGAVFSVHLPAPSARSAT